MENMLTKEFLTSGYYKEPNIELFKLIIEEKEVIDPVRWILNVEEQVNIGYSKYLKVMSKRYEKNIKIMKSIHAIKELLNDQIL